MFSGVLGNECPAKCLTCILRSRPFIMRKSIVFHFWYLNVCSKERIFVYTTIVKNHSEQSYSVSASLHPKPIQKPNVPRPMVSHIIRYCTSFSLPDEVEVGLRQFAGAGG